MTPEQAAQVKAQPKQSEDEFGESLYSQQQSLRSSTYPRSMAEMSTVSKNVRQHWLAQGLRISAVPADQLDEFRQRFPRGIPQDYTTFLSIAGLPDDEDAEGFRFWPLREVRSTRVVLQDAGYGSDVSACSVIIADYLQESWWYCLWLDGPAVGQVSAVWGTRDGNDPQPPLGTLASFLRLYLDDDERLYPFDGNVDLASE